MQRCDLRWNKKPRSDLRLPFICLFLLPPSTNDIHTESEWGVRARKKKKENKWQSNRYFWWYGQTSQIGLDILCASRKKDKNILNQTTPFGKLKPLGERKRCKSQHKNKLSEILAVPAVARDDHGHLKVLLFPSPSPMSSHSALYPTPPIYIKIYSSSNKCHRYCPKKKSTIYPIWLKTVINGQKKKKRNFYAPTWN